MGLGRAEKRTSDRLDGRSAPPRVDESSRRSVPLEPAAGALLPVLLALVSARITGEESHAFQLAAKLDVEFANKIVGME